MKIKIISLVVAVVAMILILLGSGVWLFMPVKGQNASVKSFIIPKGQAISIIGSRLVEENLIHNALVFRFYVKFAGLENKIQAGTFQLSSNLNLVEITQELTKGTQDEWVTIVEGWRKEEIAEALSDAELSEFDQIEFLSLAKQDEGYLFPDTYLIPKLASSETIYQLLRDTFVQKVEMGLSEELEKSPRSLEEIIILASLLEREAREYQQMRHVAGILQNRISLGIPLQVDATLQYAKGYSEVYQSWWSIPLAIDKQIESLFNTYQNAGLPPAPICSPGLDAIRAAINPLATDDLFYIHDTKGQMHFAQTLGEHNANVDKYLR